MTFQVEVVSRQQMFAGVVKVQLKQVKACVADDAERPRIGVDLDRMSVVDDAQRKRFVIISDGARISLQSTREVNGRLLQTKLTYPEVCLQLSPMLRPLGTLIRPVGCARDPVLSRFGRRRSNFEAASASDCSAEKCATIDWHAAISAMFASCYDHRTCSPSAEIAEVKQLANQFSRN